ncbi:SseB family protein [Paramicrobacterium agarici]|uniref:SseB family protein n=1 Tax=Paramicrobacterium agarici TaxID=630514 RepID=UPI001151147C|nr:SseB family protein [Microbacterium agarici]TQO24119.1 type III secretion system (T3SS) SseB-like protein [Microbacterium agarici]
MSHPTDKADSAGQPWEGRSFRPNDRAADDGGAPPGLVAAIESFHRGGDDGRGVVAEFATSRLLIPLVAHAGEHGVTDEGLVVDKTQELSIITVEGPDGRNVMPVFSSVATMQAWNPQARPVPAEGVRVALAAAEERTDLVVLDATSRTEFVIRRPALWAVAQSHPWIPSFADPEVLEAFERSAVNDDRVVAVRLAPGDPTAQLRAPETVVTLTLVPGLGREELSQIVTRLSELWAADEVIANRVDSLKVAIAAQSSG